MIGHALIHRGHSVLYGFTLAGAVAGGDQTWTNVGDMTFAAGSVLASGSTNGNTLLIKANDTTFLTLTTGATDTLDIGAHNISGDSTVTATKKLTFGNVGTTISDTYVQLSNGSGTAGPKLKYGDATTIYVRNAADNANASMLGYAFTATAGFYISNTGFLNTQEVNDYYAIFRCRDNDVGNVEVARLQNAADPYFMVGRDDTGVALNAVTDGLKLQMAGGTGNSSAGQGFGMPFLLGNAASETEERASIDVVLVTATNGAEDARFDFNVQAAGAAPSTILSLLGKSAYMGTSGAPIALTVGTPTFALYSTCASTDGGTSAQNFLVSNTMTGIGGVGGRAAFEGTANVALAGWANALKAKWTWGASGYLSGLGSAFCAEMVFSAGTETTGQYGALEAELVCGTGAKIPTVAGFLYCNGAGEDVATTIDTGACLIALGSGLTAGSGKFIDTDITTHTAYAGLRVYIQGVGFKYIPLVND